MSAFRLRMGKIEGKLVYKINSKCTRKSGLFSLLLIEILNRFLEGENFNQKDVYIPASPWFIICSLNTYIALIDAMQEC